MLSVFVYSAHTHAESRTNSSPQTGTLQIQNSNSFLLLGFAELSYRYPGFDGKSRDKCSSQKPLNVRPVVQKFIWVVSLVRYCLQYFLQCGSHATMHHSHCLPAGDGPRQSMDTNRNSGCIAVRRNTRICSTRHFLLWRSNILSY